MRPVEGMIDPTRLARGLLLLGILGCGPKQPQGDHLTQRQRDSVLGASQLPGATGVRGALRVSDSAAARRGQEDSISQ